MHTSSSLEVMSRHRWRVLPSNSSRRMNFPPSREALWPSRGWPSPVETGRHSETGQRGGERRSGGITVAWIETSVRDCVASGARGARGTPPGLADTVEGGTASGTSSGFTRDMLESEEAGEAGVVSIMMTSTQGSLACHLERLYHSLCSLLLSHEEEKCSENFYNIPAIL